MLCTLGVLAAIACAAPPALASVQITPEAVTVTTAGGRAVVDRHHFRIRFRDGAGQALSEVPNTGQAPLPQAALSPTPGTGSDQGAPQLYAPLSFTVGADAVSQEPGAEWVGNLLIGAQAGVQYSARDVIAVAREGDGARLVVSTSDPSGRKLVVRVAPDRGGAIRVRVRPTPDDGVAVMSDSFATAPGEAFRGFGGRHNALDQHGHAFYSWVEQENVGAGPLQPLADPLPDGGGNRYLFPNGPTAAYYAQPLFISSRPYGFLLSQPQLARFRMASDRPDAWAVAASAPSLDYVVAPGPGRTAIRSLTAITGRQRVPPRWAAGTMLDRAVKLNQDAGEYRGQVQDDLRDIRLHHLPLDAYRIEGWPLLPKPTLRRVIERLHRRGIRALLYFRGFVGQDTAGTEEQDEFGTAIANGYVATHLDGTTPYVFVSNFNAPGAVVDFTNPAAVRWWDGRLRDALDMGADGFMQDFGEQVQLDMRFHDGETGATMHNRLPVLYHRATRAFLDRYARRHPGRSFWFFTRTGYTGRPGAAAYENANFPGDETTDWSRSSGLASIATDMLNRGVGGATGFTMDIGGYVDVHTPATTRELFVRWAEAAALSPYFRLHGSVGAGTHTPWSYGPATLRTYRRLSRLHLRARPLILRLWRQSARSGIPVARPLWLQAPGDRNAARQDQEWMLGPDVLVAPVVIEGARARRVYFPAGCWRDPVDGAEIAGGRRLRVRAPLWRLPYFTRCGTHPLG